MTTSKTKATTEVQPTFEKFSTVIRNQFANMQKGNKKLMVVDLPKEEVWDFYLNSFPAGTNEVYKERREYDCNACKQFIRTAAGIVTLNPDGSYNTIWDVEVGGYYSDVAKAMATFINSLPVKDVFLHFEGKIGKSKTLSANAAGVVEGFSHFAIDLPREVVKHKELIDSTLGDLRTNKEVLKRSLDEITQDAFDTVLELIEQGSLYRGDQNKRIVQTFVTLKRDYDKAQDQNVFAWEASSTLGSAGRIRNTSIGQLLTNLSDGMDMEVAVKKFEDMVSGTNYQRPTALVTKGMIDKAQQKVEELGMSDSLYRRFAVTKDLTINNVLFADRSAKKAMDPFAELVESNAVKSNKPKLDGIEEISIKDFITNVLPKAQSLEVLVENKLKPNFMSLIAPQYLDAPNLFPWNNGFSWNYNGDVADSIKERVKAAGGNVEGELRVSLSWGNGDDLDLSVKEPSGTELHFGNRSIRSPNGGQLDVDAMAGGQSNPTNLNPVENIIYPKGTRMVDGEYIVIVNNYNKCDMKNPQGFVVEVEYKGQIYTFSQQNNQRTGQRVHVTTVVLKKGEISFKQGNLERNSKSQSQNVWGIATEQFRKVSMVVNSPNYWDGQESGTQHSFFILEGCVNPDDARGFYNEFLKSELKEHRKVFELLGSKVKAKHQDEQLSGLGFNHTTRNSVFVKVSGSFNRTLKVNF